MILAEVRTNLQVARERLIAGDTETAVQKIDRVLDELAPERLVTTDDAAQLLGIRSEYMVRLLCRTGFLDCRTEANRILVPVSEIDRVFDSRDLRDLRAVDNLHDASEEFGVPGGLSEEELCELSASRPGSVPWQS
jgi:hypothetical protein